MFVFDRETSSIRFDGDPAIALRDIRVKASVARDGEIGLSLRSAEMTATEAGNEDVLSGGYRLKYEDKQNTIAAELLLMCRGPFLAVSVAARIRNGTAYHAQRTFTEEGGIRIGIGRLEGLRGLLAASRHKEWWTRPHFDTDLRRLPPRTQSLLWKTDSGYGYLLPVCDELHRTDLTGSKEGLAVHVSSGESGRENIEMAAAFVLGADTDPYRLAANCAAEGFAARGSGGLTRESRTYPDILEYVGWCSWDAFYADVDEQGVVAKAAELAGMGLPVRWFMIDDGWSDVRDKKLYGFEASKEKFPGGLERAVRMLKEQHGIRWVGAWHNIAGYWGGIDPAGTAFDKAREYVHETRSGRWIPHPDPGRNFGFWQLWHSSLKRQGIDFVKVDNQSSLNSYFGGEQSIARIASGVHTGLEASVALHFDGCLINCMGMASENVWHRAQSSVSRSSNDFLPKIYDGFGEHALQNAYNSVYHGPFYWGDWDMFWTSHHDAVPHVTLRAVSGGPVYFSDGPGRTNPDIIRPLIYGDGKIIRCQRVGQPTEEWLTVDPLITPRAFKVWNTAGGSGVIGAFHVYGGEEEVEGEVGPGDVPYLAGKTFIVYDSFRKTAHRLQAGESVAVRLARFEAALFLIVPVAEPFTAIGLTDKLVATDAVVGVERSDCSVRVRLKDSGIFSFVSERKPTAAFVGGIRAAVEPGDEGVGLYSIVCPEQTGAASRETEVRIEF